MSYGDRICEHVIQYTIHNGRTLGQVKIIKLIFHYRDQVLRARKGKVPTKQINHTSIRLQQYL